MRIFVVKHPLGTFIFDKDKVFVRFVTENLESALKEFTDYEIKINDYETVLLVRKNIREYVKNCFKREKEFNEALCRAGLQLARKNVKLLNIAVNEFLDIFFP